MIVGKEQCLLGHYMSHQESPVSGNRRQQSPQRLGSDVGDRVPDSRLHDGLNCAPVRSNCVPEVTVLPILPISINLLLIAGVCRCVNL